MPDLDPAKPDLDPVYPDLDPAPFGARSGSSGAQRGTSVLHLNEATWIIDGSNELIVDFLFELVLFLDSTQPWPFKNPKQIFFFWIKQTNDM